NASERAMGASEDSADCAGFQSGEIFQHGWQTLREHLATDVAEQLGHHELTKSAEPGVIEGEAGAASVRLQSVGDLGNLTASVILPGVAQQRRLLDLQHDAIEDAAPAGHRFGHEPESRADVGGEPLRPAAGAGRSPAWN